MFERARVLGYSSLEECIRARILSGTTVRDLSGKLDVSESTLDKEMKKLGVRSQHQKRVRFWMV
jgi:hypothetical protein